MCSNLIITLSGRKWKIPRKKCVTSEDLIAKKYDSVGFVALAVRKRRRKTLLKLGLKSTFVKNSIYEDRR